MRTLLTKATLKSMSRKQDGSVKISFDTMEEISSEDFKLMDQYFRQDGWLAFKMNEFGEDDMPEVNAKVAGQETPSQYLRKCLFSKFMNSGGVKEDFEAYYNKTMASFARQVNDTNPGTN